VKYYHARNITLLTRITVYQTVWSVGGFPHESYLGKSEKNFPNPQRCSSSSLTYSAGLVSSSFSAESLALVHGLEWCYSHLNSCHFQSALFLTDFQSALTLLSTALARFQPKSLWDIWDLFDSLSSSVALSFQWIPGHVRLPGSTFTIYNALQCM